MCKGWSVVRIGTVGDCYKGMVLPRWVGAYGAVCKSEFGRATSVESTSLWYAVRSEDGYL